MKSSWIISSDDLVWRIARFDKANTRKHFYYRGAQIPGL